MKALIKQKIGVRGLFVPDEAGADAFKKQGGEIVCGDFTKPDTLQGITTGIDMVFHLATRTLGWSTRRPFEKVMVQGAKHLLAESTGHINRFIHFSSVAALGSDRIWLVLPKMTSRKNVTPPIATPRSSPKSG